MATSTSKLTHSIRLAPSSLHSAQDEGSLVLKIADMGISKVASEKTLQTVTNASAGTPLYMPCELLNDVEDQGGKVTKEVSERSERALRKTASF